MKLNVNKIFDTISGRALARKRAQERHWIYLRALIQTDDNKSEGIFDENWYSAAYPDVTDAGVDPLKHYILNGAAEDRKPGPNFEGDFYLECYPDVKAASLNPLVHYLEHGKAEGRVPNPRLHPSPGFQVRHCIVKELELAPGEEAALLVTHTSSGRLKPHVLPYIEQLQGAGFAVLLVVIVDRPLELLDKEIAAADGIIVRDNAGYDFGAWAHGFQLCPALFGAGLLIMTNDSVVPTADKAMFRAMIDRVRECPADVVGLTANHEYGWHIQSYFLGFKPKALSSWGFQHFIRNIRRIDDKDEVIRTYEVPFAARMQGAGLTVQALYAGTFSANPTFFSWRELIAQGFPFIKLLILRKQFSKDTDQVQILDELHRSWPAVLKQAGFDVDLVRASVRAADLALLPQGPSKDLLVDSRKYDRIDSDHTLRVAYFGPWNYENGLGAASREMLCALRHTDLRLNAYPIAKPFHVHRLVSPAVEIIDFNARPDVAIVHLNPDSWHLLTAEQQEIIRSAKRRIGYWVWETDKLPPSWKEKLDVVDRIWAPSAYCAEVFAKDAEVPVDIVPHPVRVPAQITTDRDAVLRRFNIDPKLRVILYIFDGASYIVRKNPEALIRAFAKSGLAAKGWTLVLKTKHLYDRRDAGRELTALVDKTEGVRILEVGLHADEVTSLLAAADIYASPHCSEGFGLTVAEAMAVGKPVVATDYAGTRDFLDEECGYPVAATPWTLEESHGHYLAGHSWAKVDETALAEALSKAARQVISGNTDIGAKAKAVIERGFSYEAVAAAVSASIDAMIGESIGDEAPVSKRGKINAVPAIPNYKIKFSNAPRFRQLGAAKGVVPVPLASDLSWNGNDLPEGDEGDWLIFAPEDARVASNTIEIVLDRAAHRPDVVLFYADDVAADETSLDRILLKPDYDQTLLAAQDYIGSPVIVRRKTLTEHGGLDATKGTAALYDLVLRIAEAGGSIGRITQVLIGHEGKRPVANVADRRSVLTDNRAFANVELLDSSVPGQLAQRRRFEPDRHPPVSIVIPTRRTRNPKSGQTYIDALLSKIALADWPLDKVTVIIGDDLEGAPEAWATERWPFRLLRIETPRTNGEQFNYAVKMNRLWRAATDEIIVLMNDDVLPLNSGWLSALAGFAIDKSVGGVGGRLFYDDGSLQHAGIFPMAGAVAHTWLGWPDDVRTYQNWAETQREWSMITGAVFATRRSLLEQVNGFDKRFSLEFNDIDLCLRIRSLGHRLVYNPLAEFTHTEKASRGDADPPGAEVALFLSRWSKWLENDPASHPGFIPNRLDLVPEFDRNAWYAG